MSMDWIELIKTPINIPDVVNFLSKSSCGAISLFFGAVRKDIKDKDHEIELMPNITEGACDQTKNEICVEKLYYEAYDLMAIKEMENICQNVRSGQNNLDHSFEPRDSHEFNGNLVILHRLGYVPVNEISICVGASSPHRLEGMDITKFLINEVKNNVPIWKKEFYSDNSFCWKPNK